MLVSKKIRSFATFLALSCIHTLVAHADGSLACELDYAKNFTIEEYADYKLLTVSNAYRSARSVYRYALIPHRATLPDDLPRDVIVIRTPVQRVVIMETVYAGYLDALGQLLLLLRRRRRRLPACRSRPRGPRGPRAVVRVAVVRDAAAAPVLAALALRRRRATLLLAAAALRRRRAALLLAAAGGRRPGAAPHHGFFAVCARPRATRAARVRLDDCCSRRSRVGFCCGRFAAQTAPRFGRGQQTVVRR